MKRNVIIVILFAAVLAVVLVRNLSGGDKGAGKNEALPSSGAVAAAVAPVVGSYAPGFELASLDGATSYSLDPKTPKGQVLIVNFWASWCGPCDIEAPDLVRLYEEYKGKVELYGVNVTKYDTVRGAKDFVKEKGLPFPILMDKDGKTGDDYKVFSYPISFIVDRQGIVRERIEGGKSLKEWRRMLDRALQDESGGA
ncbi:TlpA family protein disulfide reductase [Cohnella sp. 56]|uniref:TlpA family protein disulfide reductase n=1 Tax=Cohnella sp. 56 TaxID=3113722 RepID=UPI0030EA5475